jgi:hypothetical protein
MRRPGTKNRQASPPAKVGSGHAAYAPAAYEQRHTGVDMIRAAWHGMRCGVGFRRIGPEGCEYEKGPTHPRGRE